jgi:hypothetical protein
MQDDSIFERVREAIQKRSEKPASELIADMIQRGVIDRDGNVLLRMPSGPKATRPKVPKENKSSTRTGAKKKK